MARASPPADFMAPLAEAVRLGEKHHAHDSDDERRDGEDEGEQEEPREHFLFLLLDVP